MGFGRFAIASADLRCITCGSVIAAGTQYRAVGSEVLHLTCRPRHGVRPIALTPRAEAAQLRRALAARGA